MIHSMGRALEFFFRNFLERGRGASPHTLASYRQTFSLLCDFLKRRRRLRSARSIRITQLTPSVLLAFLDHLEDEHGRGNSVATRNARLAAIRSFYRALPLLSPKYLPLAKQMEHLPFKRASYRSPDYLEREELREVFASIDRSTPEGLRDLSMLLFMYNVGARASEVAGARSNWLRLEDRFRHVRVLGKGNRERICPLWDVTGAFLRHYLATARKQPRAGHEDRLFINRRGTAFTRRGVWDIVHRRVAFAAQRCPSIARKHITAHSIRHSLGVHLLQAGVDITVIRSWLGHMRLETTGRYARVRIQDAQAAVERFFGLAQVFPHPVPSRSSSAGQNESLLRWLESL